MVHHKHLQELLVNFYICFMHFLRGGVVVIVKTKDETRAQWIKTPVAKPNDQGSLPQNPYSRRQFLKVVF